LNRELTFEIFGQSPPLAEVKKSEPEMGDVKGLIKHGLNSVRRAAADDTGSFSNGSIEFTSEFTSELDR